MDDAEHSATLERVVAGHESGSQTRHETADCDCAVEPGHQGMPDRRSGRPWSGAIADV